MSETVFNRRDYWILFLRMTLKITVKIYDKMEITFLSVYYACRAFYIPYLSKIYSYKVGMILA